jgi:hypothetical protein
VPNDHDNRAGHDDPFGLKIVEVLQKLRSANRVISVAINDELGGSNDESMLEQLYCIKGGVTGAIEEIEKRISIVEN